MERVEKYLNEMFNKLIEKQIDQVLEKDTEMEEKRRNDRGKLDALANIAERHIQVTESTLLECNLARSSNLTELSNGKNYSFHQTRANWTFASEFCSKKGLNLATITDENDAQVVAAEGRRIYNDGWWVSARNVEREFQWLDGSVLELDSPLWRDGTDKTKDCVYIYNYSNGKLRSRACNENLPFICELPSECY
ncbi:hepatic lectin-like [Neocloeon triangulifer]|uniref:hepatic lectin-like n=1 Tax=Neocloeon triangulifer TaxID=2078957 RepID=UPI00286F0732|nr:hepatic lectin-like [Neocloeon triangulifer]XP_059471023.1 hepatic lectin-like [Neocloeon triangulifer]